MTRRQIEWIARAREVARTRRKLAMLDETRLADLGLTRAEAEIEAGRPFWSWRPWARTPAARVWGPYRAVGKRSAEGGRSC